MLLLSVVVALEALGLKTFRSKSLGEVELNWVGDLSEL